MSAMPGQATRDTEKIRHWAEVRNGRPVIVARGDNRHGAIRINFPGYVSHGTEPISWEAFARIFEERNLEFRYEEHTDDGAESRFFKLIGPN